MQNNSDRLDMPGAFKDTPAIDTSHHTSTSATTHLDNPTTPKATTMRSANVVNPHGSTYEVAGPFTGGIIPAQNRDLNTTKGQSLDAPIGGTGGTPAHSLTELNDQYDTNLQPISNTTNNITPASAIVSSSGTSSNITTTPMGSSSLKPLGPYDRPPVKVGFHAHKPSDKATYGNLESPGAQKHPGPLSDRTLAGTPPPSSMPKKTIADPFGPVKVANWNDHRRQVDSSTPTSEDFESPYLHGTPGRSSAVSVTAPLVAPAAVAPGADKRMHAPSPLRDELPPKAPTAHAQPPPPAGYFPHVQHDSSMDAAGAIPHQQHKEPLTERIKEVFTHHEHGTTKPTTATTAAVAAADVPLPKETLGERIKDVFHHEPHSTAEVPIKVNTPTIATSSAAPEALDRTENVPIENLKDLDLSKVAQAASHMPVKSTVTGATTTTATPTMPTDVKMEPLGEGIKETSHHESYPTTTSTTTAIPKEPLGERIREVFHHEPRPTVELPIMANTATIPTSSAAPEIFTNEIDYVPIENLKNADLSKLAQAASLMPDSMAHQKHQERPIKSVTTTVITPVVVPIDEKESLGDRVKDDFRHDPSDTTTSTTYSKYVVPAATAGTAASVAAFLNDKETDSMATPSHTHDQRSYQPPGVKSNITPTAAPETHVSQPVDTSPLKTNTQVSDPVFDTTYMDTPPAHAHAPAAAAVAPIIPVVPTTTSTAKPSTSEIHFTDPKTLVPVTEHRTSAISGETDHRSIPTKLKDAVTFHSASEYGPADPKDLHLSDPKTLHLDDHALAAVPVAAATAVVAPSVANSRTTATTTTPAKDATVVAPAIATSAMKPATNEIQFTDPTTLRPLTGTRTWDIPPTADHRSMITKVKDAIGIYNASDYGPADPKDLHLSDPKTLGLTDRVPVAPAMAANGAAAGIEPIIATTTTTKPATNEIQFMDPTTLRPLTGTRTWDIPPTADHRSMITKVKDAIGIYNASDYGPADPKDLHLSDPKTLGLTDRVPVAPAMATTADTAGIEPIIATATTTKPATNEIQFTDPTTLRPLTGTRTWDIPPTADHRSMITKVKDAIGIYNASDYGPADPKDLNLSDPKTLRLIDRIPVAPALAATGAAAAVAPSAVANKMTTDTTKPMDVKEENTSPALMAPRSVAPLIPVTAMASTTNPVMTAPHPVTPETSSTSVSKSEVNPVPIGPHPVIPETATMTHHDEPNPVQTDPRPMIPASATETHSTTTPHSDPGKVAAPLVAAAAVAPLVTPASTVKPTAPPATAHVPAPVPIVEKTAATTPATPNDNKPAPVVQAPISQQYNTQPRELQPSSNTSSTNTAPIHAATAAPLNTQPRQYQPSSTNTAPIHAATAAPLNTQPRQYQPSSTNTAPIHAAAAAPLIAQGRSSNQERAHVDKIAATVPEDYQGPIPQLQPGEEIVWVKTVTTTDYYDDNTPPGLHHGAPANITHNTNNSNNKMSAAVGAGDHNAHGVQGQGVPANTVHNNTTGSKRHSGFFDRLIHRHHENVDKGKQRT